VVAIETVDDNLRRVARHGAGPLVTVKLVEGVCNESEKREVIEKLTDTTLEIERENMRGIRWVVVEEVKSGRWGIGGNAFGTGPVERSRLASPDRSGKIETKQRLKPSSPN
jgi:4-oxalocrotonate tautomerase